MLGYEVGHWRTVFVVEFHKSSISKFTMKQHIIAEVAQNHDVRIEVASIGRSGYEAPATATAAA